MWFYGPDFLQIDRLDVELEDNLTTITDNLPELKSNVQFTNNRCAAVNLSTELPINPSFNDYLFNKFSSLTKLTRVVAYILRFKNRSLLKKTYEYNTLTVDELDKSLLVLIKLVQHSVFKQELVDLKRKGMTSNTSKILNLSPFLDSECIIRVGGRLTNSELKYEQKHPIILPYKHRLTDLIIREAHLKNLHAGIQNLLSIIRLKFWPINGKNAVKRIIGSCQVCYRVNPRPTNFLMGSLPRSRVVPSRPFSKCGVDYAGPIYVKDGTLRTTKLIKTYICIFVCFATRATHLELVKDLSTSSFLNALKRFYSRRGKPHDIYSDNGSNFVGANNYFVELYDLINKKDHNESVTKFLADNQIRWHFIPAKSPHLGGLWEAAVRSCKFHLRRVLGNSSLSYEEMYTLLVQVEACLNSRPLVPISHDVNDFLPLSPAHFLIGDSLLSPPEEDLKDMHISRLSRYQKLQQLFQHFWNRWSREYLTFLQVRNKWNTKNDLRSQLPVGSLVILVEDNLPPLRWPLARVTELHPGSDNVIRVVSVRLPNGTITRRSLKKVCILPMQDELVQCEENAQ